ncbi:MAG: lysylphosphatidylglycerol synthase transmembrane domain-containing protein [bacterium]
MQLPRRFVTRSFVVLGFSIALYAAGALVFGWSDMRDNLRAVPAGILAMVGLLSLTNYLLRFWRWEVYLRCLGVRIPLATSLGLYFSAYVMVITPGKIGEVFKAGILGETHGVSLAKGIPVVLAERLYDFLAVLLLAIVGIVFWPGPVSGLGTGLAAATCLPAVMLLFRHPGIRRRLVEKAAGSALLKKHRLGLDESLESLASLLTVRQLAFSLTLTSLAWFCECLGLWLVCKGLGFPVGVGEAVFVYAAGTLVGSLSFLPGGLGGTEATIIWLLGKLALPTAVAASAALLVRLFTLWLAVALGLAVFLAARSRFQAPGPERDSDQPA